MAAAAAALVPSHKCGPLDCSFIDSEPRTHQITGGPCLHQERGRIIPPLRKGLSGGQEVLLVPLHPTRSFQPQIVCGETSALLPTQRYIARGVFWNSMPRSRMTSAVSGRSSQATGSNTCLPIGEVTEAMLSLSLLALEAMLTRSGCGNETIHWQHAQPLLRRNRDPALAGDSSDWLPSRA